MKLTVVAPLFCAVPDGLMADAGVPGSGGAIAAEASVALVPAMVVVESVPGDAVADGPDAGRFASLPTTSLPSVPCAVRVSCSAITHLPVDG